MKHLILLLIAIPLISSCAAKRPILYPNAKLKSVGIATAQTDIDSCIALANTSGTGSNVAKTSAKTGAKGATTGGVISPFIVVAYSRIVMLPLVAVGAEYHR